MRKINWLIWTGALLHIGATVFHTFDCSRRVTIANLTLSRARVLQITGDHCWEISQPLYYQITAWNRVVVPLTNLPMVTGSGTGYRFKVFEAEGGSLIGLLRTETRLTQSPSSQTSALILMQDLQSGATWTPEQQYSESFDYAQGKPKSEAELKAIAQNYRQLFDRLRREHPQLPLPDSLAQTAATSP